MPRGVPRSRSTTVPAPAPAHPRQAAQFKMPFREGTASLVTATPPPPRHEEEEERDSATDGPPVDGAEEYDLGPRASPGRPAPTEPQEADTEADAAAAAPGESRGPRGPAPAERREADATAGKGWRDRRPGADRGEEGGGGRRTRLHERRLPSRGGGPGGRERRASSR
jgi:hypothetical protein